MLAMLLRTQSVNPSDAKTCTFQTCQYHGCWCLGSLSYQANNNHGADYAMWIFLFSLCLVHTKLVPSTFSKMLRNGVKLCADGMNVVTTVYSPFTNLMDVLWTQWTGWNGKDISERRDCSKSWGDHPVPKLDGMTTCLKRDGRSTNGIAVFRTY